MQPRARARRGGLRWVLEVVRRVWAGSAMPVPIVTALRLQVVVWMGTAGWSAPPRNLLLVGAAAAPGAHAMQSFFGPAKVVSSTAGKRKDAPAAANGKQKGGAAPKKGKLGGMGKKK